MDRSQIRLFAILSSPGFKKLRKSFSIVSEPISRAQASSRFLKLYGPDMLILRLLDLRIHYTHSAMYAKDRKITIRLSATSKKLTGYSTKSSESVID